MKEELYWGKLTWCLFHTIAEKITDIKELTNIINLIVLICQNLPCPYCKQHAQTYLNKKSIHKLVKTKDDLKRYLFEFHNVVNMRTKKQIQPIQILEQYSKINLGAILHQWLKFFRIFRLTPYVMREHSEREKAKQKVYGYLISIQDKLGG